MKIIYSNHAKKRIKERAIKEEWIQEGIEMPNYSVNKMKIIESYKKIGDKVLKIVYSKKDNFIKVISVMWK